MPSYRPFLAAALFLVAMGVLIFISQPGKPEVKITPDPEKRIYPDEKKWIDPNYPCPTPDNCKG